MIELRGVSKNYGALEALRDVSLSVPQGQFCVVLGPSGAGKSTLLRCINRLTEPTRGEVLVEKVVVPSRGAALRAMRGRAAMIFQDHHLVPRMSVLKNVLAGRLAAMPTMLSLLQWFPRSDIDLAMECLERVGLADRAWDRADRLSGGQRQRVGVARALAQQPRAILADEPVASLDPTTARVVLSYLRHACRELGITVLCNLHQVEYAREFADRVVGLANGRVAFDGAPGVLDASALATIYDQNPTKLKPMSTDTVSSIR